MSVCVSVCVCVYVSMRACTCGHHRAFKSKRDLTGSTTERADEIYREKGEEEGEKDSHLRAGPGSTRVRSREKQEKEREKKKKSKRKESDTSESDT